MLLKFTSQTNSMFYQDVDMLRYKENNFATQYILPRRIKRNLPTLPEDAESSCLELRKSKLLHRKRRQRRLRLPVLHENDEC
ncbi:jg26745 [Pararge aegeria aegeria]|uniref:Jg26745 protein n=1 Tax=Pararge aegeria aegeria TaxID=348720 RepID=A0A8S4SDJ8_9NEOP|nr:jg26745 [Pararge aegeria aegeria]